MIAPIKAVHTPAIGPARQAANIVPMESKYIGNFKRAAIEPQITFMAAAKGISAHVLLPMFITGIAILKSLKCPCLGRNYK